MPLRQAKLERALNALDNVFGSPAQQRKGFASEDMAAASAATLLASRMSISYGSALDVVKRWYRGA